MEEVRNEVQNEEPETGKENESKSERFIRLAEGRVTKARMAISRLSYLSNTGNYEYTPQQVEQMFSVLEQELAEVKSGFMKTAKEEKKFPFSKIKIGGKKIAISYHRKTECSKEHCGSASCHGTQKRVSAGKWLSGVLVCGASGRTGSAQCLRCQIRQVEHCRFAHPTAEVAVSGVCQHQKAVWHPAKSDAPPGCGQHCEQLRCRTVRLGDLRERKRDLISLKIKFQNH